jgi:hypothetical protein
MYTDTLAKVIKYAKEIGLEVVIDNGIDKYFKGDLDGQHIYCADITPEEKLFNVLHLIGHSVQWNVSDDLRKLGSKLHKNPSAELLGRLQTYEWEANCYALHVLHEVGEFELDKWLSTKYVEDMMLLTHFYLTGEKIKDVSGATLNYPFKRELVENKIPPFVTKKSEKRRNGIVINFDEK